MRLYTESLRLAEERLRDVDAGAAKSNRDGDAAEKPSNNRALTR